VIFNTLEHLVNSFSHAKSVHQIDQVQVRKLTIQAVDLDVDVADLFCRDLQINRSLNGTRPCLQISLIQQTVIGNLFGKKNETDNKVIPFRP
jgi:hypothetical protein